MPTIEMALLTVSSFMLKDIKFQQLPCDYFSVCLGMSASACGIPYATLPNP